MTFRALASSLFDLPPCKPSAVPLTFWRTLQLFNGLMAQPLSVQECIAHLDQVADRTVPLSEDTVQIYLNTLRAVGCDITRPSASNDYRYQLGQHPFQAEICSEQLQALATVRRWLENHQGVDDVLIWDEVVSRLLDACQVSGVPAEVEAYATYLVQARAVDYRWWKPWIVALQRACAHERLLRITYRSTGGDSQVYAYLPVSLRFENGAPFVMGLTQRFPDMVSLRLDRITALEDWPETAELTGLRQPLLTRKYHPPQFELVIDDMSLALWPAMGLGETVVQASAGNLRVRVATHETFILRQKLMSLGRPVSVLRPDWFRRSLRSQYEAMATLYQDEDHLSG